MIQFFDIQSQSRAGLVNLENLIFFIWQLHLQPKYQTIKCNENSRWTRLSMEKVSLTVPCSGEFCIRSLLVLLLERCVFTEVIFVYVELQANWSAFPLPNMAVWQQVISLCLHRKPSIKEGAKQMIKAKQSAGIALWQYKLTLNMKKKMVLIENSIDTAFAIM